MLIDYILNKMSLDKYYIRSYDCNITIGGSI